MGDSLSHLDDLLVLSDTACSILGFFISNLKKLLCCISKLSIPSCKI